jgi:hypothetical protein
VTRLRCTRRRCEAHRVAISNHRLIAFENDQFTFRWKDYRCASSYSARRPTELIPPQTLPLSRSAGPVRSARLRCC